MGQQALQLAVAPPPQPLPARQTMNQGFSGEMRTSRLSKECPAWQVRGCEQGLGTVGGGVSWRLPDKGTLRMAAELGDPWGRTFLRPGPSELLDAELRPPQ